MKHILTAVAVLPLFLSASNAAQRWTINPSESYGIFGEDSGKTSYLGVDIADISADRLGALKLKEEQGVEVTMVDQDAPAGKAGIKEHDVILTMNGAAVESKTQLQRMIHETPAGRLVTLGLSRDGQPVTVKVQLGDRRSEFPRVAKGKDSEFRFEVPPIPPIPNMPDFDIPNIGVVYVHSSMRSGLMVENLTPQLGEFFGAKNGGGVLVRSVEKGSRADRAGLRAGDVIVRVGDQSVHDTSDFTHALQTRNAGSVNVEVIRDKKPQTLTLALPERKNSGNLVDESSEAPDLDADTLMEMSEVQDQVAKLRPQIELAAEKSRHVSKEIQKAFCEQQQQLKKETEKLKQEITPKIRQELEKSRKEVQKEMEQMRQEISDSLDI